MVKQGSASGNVERIGRNIYNPTVVVFSDSKFSAPLNCVRLQGTYTPGLPGRAVNTTLIESLPNRISSRISPSKK